jgi:hypothetical protein
MIGQRRLQGRNAGRLDFRECIARREKHIMSA